MPPNSGIVIKQGIVHAHGDCRKGMGSAFGGPRLGGDEREVKHILPGADKAIINPQKLTDYALNHQHPVGGNKAKVFESVLGYNQTNADELMKQILDKLPQTEAILGPMDIDGQRYIVDISITGVNGHSAIVRTGWIIRPNTINPELTTLFVK